ncbi:MAG: hypothetical protein Q8N03_02815 [Ignavibacteria bacterium]|nr:hypothetical protein [Ignavibacteria bacterium]
MEKITTGFNSFNLLLILFLIQPTTNIMYAQDYNWTITVNNNTEYNDVIPLEIRENYLILKSSTALTGIDVEKIVSLKKRVGATTGSYVGYGAIIGGGILTLINIINPQDRSFRGAFKFYVTLATILNSAAIGGLVGGLIGGLVGYTASSEEVYDFKDIPLEERLTQLDWIIKHMDN